MPKIENGLPEKPVRKFKKRRAWIPSDEEISTTKSSKDDYKTDEIPTKTQQDYNKTTTRLQQECNKSATRLQQEYNKSATRLQQEYNKSATRLQQDYNKDAEEKETLIDDNNAILSLLNDEKKQDYNKTTTRVQQECNKSATRLQQECNKSATRLQQECNKTTTRLQQDYNDNITNQNHTQSLQKKENEALYNFIENKQITITSYNPNDPLCLILSIGGTQRDVFWHIAKECFKRDSPGTGPIEIKKYFSEIGASIGVVRMTISRLLTKGVIQKINGKLGRNGFSFLVMPEIIFSNTQNLLKEFFEN